MRSKTIKSGSKSVKPAVKGSKKVKAMEIVNSFKHKRVVMVPAPTEAFPEMVLVTTAPAWAKSIVGKRYITMDRVLTIIEGLDAEKLISKGSRSVLKEFDAAGIVPLDAEMI